MNFSNIEDHFCIAVWHITETEDELFDLCKGHADEKRLQERISAFKSETRRKETLATYCLLSKLLPRTNLFVEHNEKGKPSLKDHYVSISHTKDYAAVILSKTQNVAIDIERINSRVEKITSRFIRKDEEATTLSSKLSLWCAKETCYKYFSEQNLNFHEMRRIGNCIVNERTGEAIHLYTKETADYMLTYTIPAYVKRLDTVDSTNNYLLRHSAELSGKSIYIVAEEQTSGRGNATNIWHSEKGKNLIVSLLIRPTYLKATDSFLLSQAVALAIAETASMWVPKDRIKVKWPNDIYIEGENTDCEDKKLCGTLIETSLFGNHLQDAIIGIGLNINQMVFPDYLPNPVSMVQIHGATINREEVLSRLIAILTRYMAMLQIGQHEEIKKVYLNRMYLINQKAVFADEKETFEASVQGIDRYGRLQLLDSYNVTRHYDFKQVKLIKHN